VHSLSESNTIGNKGRQKINVTQKNEQLHCPKILSKGYFEKKLKNGYLLYFQT
jgi:hypothetical protein